jgi:hypothetical protein
MFQLLNPDLTGLAAETGFMDFSAIIGSRENSARFMQTYPGESIAKSEKGDNHSLKR